MKLRPVFDSILSRLLLLALGIVLIGTVARYYALSSVLRQDLSTLVADQQSTLATYVARDIDAQITQRKTRLEALAAALPAEWLEQPERLHAWLGEQHSQEQSFFAAGLQVVDAHGNLVAETSEPTDLAHTATVVHDARVAGVETRSLVGLPIAGPTGQGPFLPFAAPVRDADHRVRAVLVGWTSMTAPGFLDALRQSRVGRTTGRITVVAPKARRMVASSQSNTPLPASTDAFSDPVVAAFQGVSTRINGDGVEEISATTSIPSTGWVVDARLPTAEAFATEHRLQRFLIDRAALAVLVFLSLALPGLYLIFRPLFRAARLAERMARNEIPLKPLPVVRNDEIGHLISAFNGLLVKLNNHKAELARRAHFDLLTALPNRVLFADRLHQAMLQAQRTRQLLAVAYLDLDGFKAVNDQHGHAIGDLVLVELAKRMKHALREGDTLARLGGDEFVAVLQDPKDVSTCTPIIDRILTAAAAPLDIDGHTIRISASIGVTLFPQPEDVDADQLLRQADQAMYKAKLAGKNRCYVFDADQDRHLRGHNESVEHIRQALGRHEFVLHYQPKVNMRTGAVIGAEALIRWQHPERGLLPPAAFLPVIEDHPLAVEVGEWVIDTALTQMAQWRAAGLSIPVSVNVGARHLQQDDFVDRLRGRLRAHPTIKPCDLELEILETSALEDLARVSHVIESCRALGVLFTLDDFGTGYSSLTYLKRLPVAQLKIDQSFVRDMLVDPDDLAILGGVLGLATAFRLHVVAEGVETIEHGEMLLQLGCERAQGYGIARPMPADALPAWAAHWQMDPAWRNVRPLNRDDFPLLFAAVEHRAWIALIEKFLHRGHGLPPLALHSCRFGSWLASEGKSRFAAQPLFQGIERLHQQIHARVTGLAGVQARGQDAETSALLAELHHLQEAFVAQLRLMLSTPDDPEVEYR